MTRGFRIEQKNTDLRTNVSPGQEGPRTFRGWPVVIGWAGMLIFTFYACTRMVAAGDTWVAMACGRHFVQHGVDTVEPFSANSHKAGPTPEEIKKWPPLAQWIANKVGLETLRYWHPTGWVNQNWLTHVIFYKLTTALGSESEPYYDALVLWKFALYLLAMVVLYYTARLYGVNPLLAAVFVCFAMVIGRTFFDIRPAGFSNLLVAVLVLILALASYKNVLYVWLLVPLVIFWSNVHGGYIYAFLMVIPFVGWHAVMNLPRRWMIVAYSSLTWLVLCAMANRFTHHDYLTPIALGRDLLFYLTILGIAGSVALARNRKIGDDAFLVYHIVASCVLFLALLPRFFPAIASNVPRLERDKLDEYIVLSRLSYLGIFSFALVLGAVVAFLKDRVVRVMSRRGIVHTMAAGAVAFVAMVIFNPFHLTNVTHTFVISISKHAERWRDVHEWNRAFDWTNPVGTAVPFLLMYILAWLVLVAWTVILIRAARAVSRSGKKRLKTPVDYAWPQVDVGLLIIGAMTIYMAIRSRRFIPIAGFAAGPMIALLLEQVGRVTAATVQFSRTGKFETPPMPASLQRGLTLGAAIVVLGCGFIWGLRFKHVYLDPWPLDAKYTSVFMRMTASYTKPFEVCEFMRLNQLRGNMYNYWTEGGCIAWGQQPDPETGRIPLQLFMDGRAQAAYDVPTFDRWSNILSAGELISRIRMVGRTPSAQEYAQAGEWVSGELRKHDVWVVLMPDLQFDQPFTQALEYAKDWRLVYTDDKQKLFVDVESPKGRELYQGMFLGRTVYPNEYLANMAVGHELLVRGADAAQRKKALEHLIQALRENPSPAPMKDIVFIGLQFPELQPRIDQVCREYVADFETNRAAYARQDGYDFRLHVAWLALARLKQVAEATRDTRLAQTYEDGIARCREELDRSAQWKKW
jgi:hypothetical protein